MSEWLRAIGPAVANHLWQSTAFAAAVWAITLLLRKNQARLRYSLWMAASLKFLIPFSLLVAVGGMLPRPQKPVVAAQLYSAVDEVGMPFADVPISAPDPVLAPAKPRHPLAAHLPDALAAVWILGMGAALTVWCGAWLRVKRTLRRASPVEDGREAEILRRIEDTMPLRRRVRLVLSRERMEPGIFGIWSPVLIWPERLSERLDDEHIHAILAHELMHARRRDNLTAALHMAVEAAFWFHPLVWWMERRMVEERERACDEAVVALGSRPGIYAESLLRTCRFCVESPLVCVAGITGSDLAARVKAIMTLRLERLSLWRKLVLAAFALVTVSAPILLGQAGAAQRLMLAAVNAAPMPWRTAARTIMPLEETPSAGLIAERKLEAAPAIEFAAPPVPESVPQAAPIKPLMFDVVSIKLNKSGGYQSSDIFPVDGDGMIIANWTLEQIIKFDYAIHREPGLDGLPPWAKNDHYDIEAKVAQSDVAAWRKLSGAGHRLVLRALLADSFKLKMRSENRDLPIYALTVTKNGPKNMKETKAGDLDSDVIRSLDGTPLGGWVPRMRKPGDPMVAHQMSMGYFLFWLNAINLGRPVYNQTGLTGFYDFTLQFAPVSVNPTDSDSEANNSGPSIFTALQEQLGLKLESTKGPVPVMVVEQVERPSED